MLVLSRRLNEKIVFPCINAAVQVVAVRSGLVRIGIEAPPDVAVFRQEVFDRLGPQELAGLQRPHAAAASKLRELNHVIRNRLNVATVGVGLLRRQIQAGVIWTDLEATVDKIEHELQTMHHQLKSTKEQVVPPPLPKACKALLVEDDRNECELLAGFLRLAGFNVDTAGDGAAALDYLCAHSTQQRPDVMLLDMGLPGCDGPTIVDTVRQYPEYTGLKIFAVSGHAPEEFSLASGPQGIDRWFRKPLNPETLVREMNQEPLSVA